HRGQFGESLRPLLERRCVLPERRRVVERWQYAIERLATIVEPLEHALDDLNALLVIQQFVAQLGGRGLEGRIILPHLVEFGGQVFSRTPSRSHNAVWEIIWRSIAVAA